MHIWNLKISGGALIDCYLEFGGTNIIKENVSNTGNYTFNFTEEERQLLLSKCPSSNTLAVRFGIQTRLNGNAIGWSWLDRIMTVVNSNPTFSNCEWKDINSDSLELTGNNQIFINGHNTLQVTIPIANKAEAINSATMDKYRLVCGNNTPVEKPYSSDSDVVLSMENVTNMTFILYAIDSRGNSTPVTKSFESWKDYSAPVIKVGSAERANGVGTETTLKFEGTLWNNTFGKEDNKITKCQYIYKKSNKSEYEAPIDINPTREEDLFSFNATIKGDLEANGFNASNSFNIQIIVEDEIRTATYDVLLGSGTPAMAIHPDGVAFGTPYNEILGGCCQVGGKNLEELAMGITGDTLPIGSVMEWFVESIPVNWLRLDGQAVSRTDYKELFALYGTTYGAGDGSTTFNLPDMRTRVPVGKTSTDTEFNSLGKTGGEKTHTHTLENGYAKIIDNGQGKFILNAKQASWVSTGQIQTSHISTTYSNTDETWATNLGGRTDNSNNLQPYIATHFIVKAKQSAGVVANVVDNLNSTSEIDALSANQGNKIYDMLVKNSKNPIGEFTLWEGNIEKGENGNYYHIGTYYSAINGLLSRFPVKGSPFTRKYKIVVDYSTTNISNGHFHVKLSKNGTKLKEYLFNNIWGSTSDGTRTYSSLDFDVSHLGDGHLDIEVSPSHGSGAYFRLYRVYLLIYDVLEV